MPYSSPSGKFLVDRALKRLLRFTPALPRHVLDVGAGSGTYSDRYSKTLLRPQDGWMWTGVEIWEPYVKQFELEKKYQRLLIRDVIDLLQNGDGFEFPKRGIAFCGDVLEHMTPENAKLVVDALIKRCDVVITSIPIGHYPQEEYLGNPYEKHVKDDWTVEEVLKNFPVAWYGVENEIGVFICADEPFVGDLKKMLSPKIAAYGICKNEEKFIQRMYESIQDADEIAFCDTGSTDKTLDRLIRCMAMRANQGKFGMQVQQITVDPWRFDDARNAALSLIPDDVDVCVSIDADEQIQPGWYTTLSHVTSESLRLRGKVFDRCNHRFSTVWDWEADGENFTDHWHERIHARRGYRWKLPVHEILVRAEPGLQDTIWLNNLKMVQKPDTQKPRSNYLHLLERSLQEDPTIWKSWTFYAGELIAVGRYSEAITAIKKALDLSDSDKSYLHRQLSDLYHRTGDLDSAISEMINALALAPYLREYRVYLIRLYLEKGQEDYAKIQLAAAERITEKPTGYHYDASCWGEEFEKLKEKLR